MLPTLTQEVRHGELARAAYYVGELSMCFTDLKDRRADDTQAQYEILQTIGA